ncbi:T9SS type A sorting domain-containing protein [Hymenobacter sp. BRD67]|uniref:T9SS type A sorting domain-containing protein n=1 Tax=Hymenobacter sp. BRD67 TaxID=2675877 RepID=UPI001564DBD2|nr:T9SS type A sorting domain-containing protein [Hymenobacter sp. BRD67]QKG53569.1 T9SS type A sorting domain-containing protein [Hymenobacter sp. BRD67]
MMNPYTRVSPWSRRLRQLCLTALLAGGAIIAAQAQNFNYGAAGTTNVVETFNSLGTTATPIATTNTDDDNSQPQNIGFTFNYNGTAFTQFVLNTNGLLRLGANAPSKAAAHSIYAQTPELGPANSTDPADVNLIMPFNIDLESGTAGASYQMAVTGTAPNRVCTIQWTNVADKATAASATVTTIITRQYDNFSFQVKLYETTNQVDFVYNKPTAGTGAPNAKYVAVGLKGSSSAVGQDVLATKSSSAAWGTTTFFSGPYQPASAANAHNVRQTYLADAGRTYRFVSVPALDAAVSAIYTLGKIATPTALPQAIQAVISNKGAQPLTNVTVALNVTGANTLTDTQTIASLAPNASSVVTFAAYPSTLTVGTNNIVVTATATGDGNPANNTSTYTQLVTPNRLSYIDQGNGNPSFDYYFDVDNTTNGGVITTKQTVTKDISLTDAVITFNPTTQTGITYKVLVYDATGASGAPGNILFTSPVQTRTTTGGPVSVSLGNLQVAAGSFYVGVQENSAGGAGVLAQKEDPLRPGTFLISFSGAAPWYDLSQYNLPLRFAIEVGLGAAPTCAPPTALTATNVTATTAAINLTAATNNTGYQLVYGPTGFNPYSAGTTVTATILPFTLTGLTSATTYQVYARSNCTAGGTSLFSAPVAFTTSCDPNPVVSTFPYNQNFDTILSGQSLPCGITTLDANNDGTTWRISTENPYSGTNDMRYNGIPLNNVAADDWFFTPALALAPASSSTRYQVAFRYRTSGVGTTPTGTESLEVKSGTAATVAGQTNLLFTNNAITNTTYALANGSSTPVVALLPAGTSTQYVGFHIKSAANQGNLYIDDVSVTAVTVTATTSEALLKATTVFPNPSNGVFALDIHGANAKGSLGVQVSNTLGQVVYTGSARDNYSNKLDLSNLAPGLYNLQLRNGDDTLTRQIAIVK